MSVSIRSSEMLFKKAIYLQSKGIPFTLSGTNGAYTLSSEHWKDKQFKSKYQNSLEPLDLGFVKRVKNHVVRNEVYLNFTEYLHPSMIQYVDIGIKPPGSEFYDVYEVDVDEAYWKTALLKNVITQDLYDEGSKFKQEPNLTKDQLQYKKNVRLIALGSLARKKSVYTFTGSRIVLSSIVRSDLTEMVWYAICKHIADLMQRLKDVAGESFLMYWVDGIYVRSKAVADKMSQIIESNGYTAKVKKIDKAEYTETKAIMHDSTDESRTFNLPKYNKKKVKFNMVEINNSAVKHSKL